MRSQASDLLFDKAEENAAKMLRVHGSTWALPTTSALSGPTLIAHTQTSFKRKKSVVCAKQKNPNCYFHSAYRFTTRTLAIEVDSLVRVTRRVEKNHFAIVIEQYY